MKLRLSVVIVNWNGGELLARCLTSVRDALDAGLPGRWEAIVVDNASHDGSLDRALSAAPDAPVCAIRNIVNRGFGAACNQGTIAASGEFLLLLNPDCELRPGSAERAIAECERGDRRVGISSVALEDESGAVWRSCERLPSFATLMGEATGLKALPFWPTTRMHDWDHATDRSVGHVIGAFYLLRRETFASLGGFDERFFVYYEDMDLSLRARHAGWEVRFVAAPRSFHVGGGTSRRVKATRLFYVTRSRVQFAFKHLPRWQAWAHVVATLAFEPVARSLQCLARGALADLRFTWQGFGMLARELPAVLRAARARWR